MDWQHIAFVCFIAFIIGFVAGVNFIVWTVKGLDK